MTDSTSTPADNAALADAAVGEFRLVVNGLDMSVAMWGRVMAAVRGLFPEQTVGLSDPGAIQALMLHIVAEWVVTWEGRQAAPDPGVVAAQASAQAVAQRMAAEQQARNATADIRLTITS